MNTTITANGLGAPPKLASESRGQIKLLDFAIVGAQLVLVLILLRQFQIESTAFIQLAALSFAGFAVHAFLPFRIRPPFFAMLSAKWTTNSKARLVRRLTVAPSILGLLAQFGNLTYYDYALRLVLFAGEVFAVKHLRALCERWSHPRYFNLYGPTETNVCTYYEVPTPVPPDRTTPYPIGYTCSHLASRVVDEQGAVVPLGIEGELCIAGRGVMKGYWALPEQTARGFYRDADGTAWYRTGDVVTEAPDGCYTYLGRRDRMVKRRGYRVELGEIEACLYRHPLIREAAAVALPDEESGIRIIAYLSCREPKHPSLIEIKRFCAEHLPLYMIPDQFSWHESLPKTSTDKIDYQRLKKMH
jgi:acyl-coenzyme A synthetase/AMP-(fatty) acid ligase